MASKIKSNLEGAGRSIGKTGSKIGSASSKIGLSVLSKFNRHQRYDKDDELINHLEYDIKLATKGLTFIAKQGDRVAKTYWPQVFALTTALIKLLIHLLGDNALHFKGIEEFYHDFDVLQTHAEGFQMHPKERQRYVASLNQELHAYLGLVDQLQHRITFLAQTNAESVLIRVDKMKASLKHMMKLINSRNKRSDDCGRLDHKIDKLQKKGADLDEKERTKLEQYQSELREAEAAFGAINDHVKTLGPEFLLLVEEFVDTLTALVAQNTRQLNSEITKGLQYYADSFGLGKPADSDEHTYNNITEEWEAAFTAPRLRIESFLATLYEKNADRLDKDVDGEDGSLKLTKAINNMSNKVKDKLHELKAKDSKNGIFANYMVADPLVSFQKLNDPKANVSESYHPHRVLAYEDVYVEEKQIRAPPPLPPREISTTFLAVSLPTSTQLPSTPLMNQSARLLVDSFESVLYDEERTTASDDELSVANTSQSDLLLAGVINGDEVLSGRAETNLVKLYNSHKNDIILAPVDFSAWPQLLAYKTELAHNNDLTSSLLLKLIQLSAFFDKALAVAALRLGTREAKAVRDFPGQQPGDLAVCEGDVIEVLFDLQEVCTSYNPDGKNWVVGAIGPLECRRVGFVPNTVLETI